MIPLKDLHNAQLLAESDIELFLENKMGWGSMVSAIRETFIAEAQGKTDSQPKTIVDVPNWKNDYRMMPAYMHEYPQYIGSKIISCCSWCPEKHGIPLATGLYLLHDAETMRLLAIFDCNKTTAYRTAAATAVAVDVLSHKESKVLGILGCGQQAYYHIPAIAAVRDIDTILLHDVNRKASLDLANAFKGDIRSTTKRTVLGKADIIVTLTPTHRPHLFVKDLRQSPNVSYFAVGGDSERKIEWHPTVLRELDHYCDSLEQASHTGTVSSALRLGHVHEEDLKSLGDLMVGNEELAPGRKMFISTGVALQDLILAIKIYEGMVLRRVKAKG